MSTDIFICHTAYHLLIALSKVLSNSNVSRKNSIAYDLMLMDTIPNCSKLAEKINKTNLFKTVMLEGSDHSFASSSYFKTALELLFRGKRYSRLVDALREYDDIYVFNDVTEVGCVLNEARIKYHLIEDGLNCFKLFDQNNTSVGVASFRQIANIFLHLPSHMAESDYCLDLEINDASSLSTTINKKLIELPRTKLFSRLDEDAVAHIQSIFSCPDSACLNEASLVLTTPFCELGFSSAEQKTYYAKVLSRLPPQSCFIKPHPRDFFDYTQLVSRERIIDRTIPIEALFLGGNIHLQAVISYMSTAVQSCPAVQKIITKPGLVIPGIENWNIEIGD